MINRSKNNDLTRENNQSKNNESDGCTIDLL